MRQGPSSVWGGDSLHDIGCLDVVEIGEGLSQVRVPTFPDILLIWFLPILGVDGFNRCHACDNIPEWGEALSVEVAAVVTQIDKQLGRAGVGPVRLRECDRTLYVARSNRIIMN